MDKHLAYIYKITSPSGKIYIGQTRQLKARYYKYQCLNCKTQTKIYNSIKKHGWGSHLFEVIDFVDEGDTITIAEKEIYWIDFYKSNFCKYPKSNGLNLTDGGAGPNGYKHTKEALEKLRIHNEKMKLRPKKITPMSFYDERIKLSRNKSCKVRDIYKNCILDYSTGIYYENAHRLAFAKNVKVNVIHRSVIFSKMKSRFDCYYCDEKGIENMLSRRDVRKKIKNRIRKKQLQSKVIDIETGIIYEGVQSAAHSINVNYHYLYARLTGICLNNTNFKLLDEKTLTIKNKNGRLNRKKPILMEGEKNNRSKLNSEMVKEILLDKNKNSLRFFANKFNVSKHAIHGVVSRKTWKHIVI